MVSILFLSSLLPYIIEHQGSKPVAKGRIGTGRQCVHGLLSRDEARGRLRPLAIRAHRGLLGGLIFPVWLGAYPPLA